MPKFSSPSLKFESTYNAIVNFLLGMLALKEWQNLTNILCVCS